MPTLGHVTAVLSVVSTILTIYITYMSHQLDNRVKTADIELRKLIEQRTARQADDTFNLQIYDKVWTALQTDEKRKHDVAYALVQSLEEDKALKKHLLGLFQTPVVAEETRRAAAVSVFNIDQQALTPEAGRGAGAAGPKPVGYDAFWCEKYPGGEQVATEAANRIRGQEGVGRVRVRLLPETVNKQAPRFRVSGLVIRRDPDEGAVADKLKTWIDPVVAPNVFKIEGNEPGTATTPNYVSAYVCGAR